MVFRLNQKHSRNVYDENRPLDGLQVLASQAPRAALGAAVIATLAMNALWLASALLFGKVFPWFSILQGIVIGVAVRRWGHGFDWRFPMIAAAVAFVAAYSGGLIIAAEVAARDLGTNTFTVIFSMSEWTLSTYADEVLTPADHIFAAYAAILAAFFSRRRLGRDEVYAIRTFDKDIPHNDQES